jgi:hypothetical protein
MKNFFKKTIALTYLTIIIFGFFIPFNLSLAQNKKDVIILSTNSPTVTTNVPVTITATLDATNKGSKIISFFTTGPGYSFSPKTCNMATVQPGQTQSCSVTFGSLIDGTFWILANSDTNQTSEGVQVVVNSPYAVTVTPKKETNTTYIPLAPIPGLGNSTCTNDKGETVDCVETNKEKIPCPFGNYLNIIIKIIIGIAAVLAMVMITMGGIEYMTSELISGKEAGKETITHAVLGLVIALGAYLILNTINPQLLNVCLDKLPKAEIIIKDLGGESADPFTAIDKTKLQSLGITTCTGNGSKNAVSVIGQQFIGKTTYSQEAGKRNTINLSKIILDCSAFVTQVYICAGLPNPGGNSNTIFSTGNTTSVDGKTYDFNKLHPGDLVGWKPSDDARGHGHVAIYIGNGQILDTQSETNATKIRDLNSIKNRIKYIKWP